LVSTVGAGTLRLPPSTTSTPPLVIALRATGRSGHSVEALWRAYLIATAFKRHHPTFLQLEVHQGQRTVTKPLDTLEPLSPRLPTQKARQIVLHGLAKLGWIPKTVTIYQADGTDAYIVAELPKHAVRPPKDDDSAPYLVGQAVIGSARTRYGMCDDCTPDQPRFSSYFLRLVDPHGHLILEGGLVKLEFGWISGWGAGVY